MEKLSISRQNDNKYLPREIWWMIFNYLPRIDDWQKLSRCCWETLIAWEKSIQRKWLSEKLYLVFQSNYINGSFGGNYAGVGWYQLCQNLEQVMEYQKNHQYVKSLGRIAITGAVFGDGKVSYFPISRYRLLTGGLASVKDSCPCIKQEIEDLFF